ncbi:hypothetical protein [Streptomyces orinoci]|uniref:DUF7848 domain-containing protein n=1 Tax=Streptomyces orinoci TaxID=67339 RepID=A0ABV3K423_STRON|nr:hypothetical protein [Streptomyces orinoci]
MSAHTILRYATWVIGPEAAPEAPEILHVLACTTCSAASEATEEFEGARDWAFQHSGRNPSHTGHRETVTRFWRAAPLN